VIVSNLIGIFHDLDGFYRFLCSLECKNPYVTLYPKTPSELYTQQDAEEAVRLATLIVDTVNDQYFS
jgi:HEPN domain-containing protein